MFHSLNYDLHFLIKELATTKKMKGKVSLISQNKENYISFEKKVHESKINYRFIDSFRFLPESLDKLAGYLEKDQKKIVVGEFKKGEMGYSHEHIDLLLRKGTYPYDFTSFIESLETTHLPLIKDFYNKLNDCGITNEEYQHAEKIWNTFNISTLGEYSDIYLKGDVLLANRLVFLKTFDLRG